LNSFVGEFLILSSTFTGVSRGWAIAASMGVILGAAYMLTLVQRLFYGPSSDMVTIRQAPDLGFRELAVLCPIVALTLVMGIVPSIWLPAIKQGVRARNADIGFSIEQVVRQYASPVSSDTGGQR
jgi:NADH-quinone oxidoreductase subunit M